jgi:hypothetical protein
MILNNDEDLVTKFEFLRYLPGYSIVKDTNSKYQGFSTALLQWLGWQNFDEAIGNSAYDVPSKFSQHAEAMIKLDQKAIKSNHKILAIQTIAKPL